MLAIVGNNTDIHKDPVFTGTDEIWVLNGKGATLPRYDRVFQMHLPCDWGGQWSRNWFRDNRKVPVYVREVHPDIPMSVQYPFNDVFGMLANVRHNSEPLRYFTSSIAWAIALAILEERRQITVKGIEMQDKEYMEQTECFTFWVGFAAGRGINLNICGADKVFSKPLYGSYPLP